MKNPFPYKKQCRKCENRLFCMNGGEKQCEECIECGKTIWDDDGTRDKVYRTEFDSGPYCEECYHKHNGLPCELCGEFAVYYSDNEPCLINEAGYYCDRCVAEEIAAGRLQECDSGYETTESEAE